MSAQNKKIYTSLNKDGYLCTYDSVTHKCIGILLATGMDIEKYNQECKEYIGQIDPKYSK